MQKNDEDMSIDEKVVYIEIYSKYWDCQALKDVLKTWHCKKSVTRYGNRLIIENYR